jgi:hypothetical protein
MHVTSLKNHISQELLAAANDFVDLSLYTGRPCINGRRGEGGGGVRAVREGIFDHGYFSPGKSSEENSKNT